MDLLKILTNLILFSKCKIDSQTSHAVLQRVLTEDFKLPLEKEFLISLRNASPALCPS
jgi:hypothetical protein